MRTILCLLLMALVSPRAMAEDVHILARSLSAKSANVAPQYPAFDDLTLCAGTKGLMEWTAELKGGSYYVHFYYCSREKRPCQMHVNGRRLPDDVLGGTTGGWMIPDLRWQTYGPLELNRGKNTIRLTALGHMPHLKGLTVSTHSRVRP